MFRTALITHQDHDENDISYCFKHSIYDGKAVIRIDRKRLVVCADGSFYRDNEWTIRLKTDTLPYFDVSLTTYPNGNKIITLKGVMPDGSVKDLFDVDAKTGEVLKEYKEEQQMYKGNKMHKIGVDSKPGPDDSKPIKYVLGGPDGYKWCVKHLTGTSSPTVLIKGTKGYNTNDFTWKSWSKLFNVKSYPLYRITHTAILDIVEFHGIVERDDVLDLLIQLNATTGEVVSLHNATVDVTHNLVPDTTKTPDGLYTTKERTVIDGVKVKKGSTLLVKDVELPEASTGTYGPHGDLYGTKQTTIDGKPASIINCVCIKEEWSKTLIHKEYQSYKLLYLPYEDIGIIQLYGVDSNGETRALASLNAKTGEVIHLFNDTIEHKENTMNTNESQVLGTDKQEPVQKWTYAQRLVSDISERMRNGMSLVGITNAYMRSELGLDTDYTPSMTIMAALMSSILKTDSVEDAIIDFIGAHAVKQETQVNTIATMHNHGKSIEHISDLTGKSLEYVAFIIAFLQEGTNHDNA